MKKGRSDTMAETTIKGYQVNFDEMSASTCGMIGQAKKDGKTFFCKKFHNPVEPNSGGALSARAIAENQAAFDLFRRRKQRVNTVLREVCGLGGNIVFPIDETVYDHHWIEFSEYIEGALPTEKYAEVIAGLKEKDKLLVLKVAIGALKTIHAQHIIHADLKLENIMLVKGSTGSYASKIIDFDGAFFEDDVPLDSITGTTDYYSPELALYSLCEEPEAREMVSKMMTTKSDIFTMGLILHEYLTGEKPKADILPPSLEKIKGSGNIYPWQLTLAQDRTEENQLVISDRIREPVYIALIADMLNPDPEQRPTAGEVLTRLNSMAPPISMDTWPEDTISISEKEVRTRLVGLRRMERIRNKEKICGYETIERNGKRFFRTADELVRCGMAKRRADLQPPRPEDKIEWNIEQLQKMFVSVCPAKKSGYYELYDRKGNLRLMSCAQLKQMQFAKLAETSGPNKVDTLSGAFWPEDEAVYQLNKPLLDKMGFTFLGASAMNDVKGYWFRSSNGTETFHPLQRCKMMGFFQPRG